MTEAFTRTSRTAAVEGEEADKGVRQWADLDYSPKTKLGRLALAARHEYVAGGGRLLSRDDIRGEVSDRQGELPGGRDR